MSAHNSLIENFQIGPESKSIAYNLLDSVALSLLSVGCGSRRKKYSAFVPDGPDARDQVLAHLTSLGFTACGLTGSVVCVLTKDGLSTAVFMVVLEKHVIRVRGCGEPQVLADFKKYFDTTFTFDGTLVRTIESIGRAGPIMRHDYLRKEVALQALPVFYPYLDFDLESFYSDYIQSKENVLVLYGAPGTGKSTFVRSLIMHTRTITHLAYAKSVLENDDLVADFYASSDAGLLALEDIDQYMMKREAGNSRMASYLNAAEGIVERNDKKITFVTNLPTIDKIDEALLRDGRCFDIVKFELLTIAQARDVEDFMGLPHQNFGDLTKVALSKVLNPPKRVTRQDTRSPNCIGFTLGIR